MEKDEIKKARRIALCIIEILEETKIEARLWDKIKNFIDYEYNKEKSKSKLNCDKNILIDQVNVQIW